MRSPLSDDHGKEAFAYLAVLILLGTSYAMVQMAIVEKDERRNSTEEKALSDLSMILDDVERRIEGAVVSLIPPSVDEAGSGLMNGSGPYEKLLERSLSARVENEIARMIERSNSTLTDTWLSLLSVEVSTEPVLVGIEAPISRDSEMQKDMAGPFVLYEKNETFGVNISVVVDMEGYSRGPGCVLRRTLTAEREIATGLPYLRGRVDDISDSVENGDLSRSATYLLSSAAQQKALLGYGMEPSGYGDSYMGPVLTEEEILSCLDLNMGLLTQSHLRTPDDVFLSGVSSNLSRAPGSGGNMIPLEESVFEGGTVDAATAVMLAEGLMSDENPPSLKQMMGPLLYYLMDLLLNRLVSYIGLDSPFLQMVGSLVEVFEYTVDVADEVYNTLTGEHLVEESRKSAESILRGLLGSTSFGLNTWPTEGIMNPSFPLPYQYNGCEIDGYPRLDVPSFNTSFEIMVTEMSDSHMLYITRENGTVHTKEEYDDPNDIYYGQICDTYNVVVDIEMYDQYPSFFTSDILNNDEFYRQLSFILGTNEDEGFRSSEKQLEETGRIAIKNAISRTIDTLTAPGEGAWESVWNGWDEEDHPTVSGTDYPISRMLEMDLHGVKDFLITFTDHLIDSLKKLQYGEMLSQHQSSLGCIISEFMWDTYDRWAKKEDQVRTALMNAELDYWLHSVSTIREVTLVGREVDSPENCTIIPGSSDNLKIWLIGKPEMIRDMCVGPGIDDIDPDIHYMLRDAVLRAYDEVKLRECSLGRGGEERGIFTKRLCPSPGTRSIPGFDGVMEPFWEEFENAAEELFLPIFDEVFSKIRNGFITPHRIAGSRYLYPKQPGSSSLEITCFRGAPSTDLDIRRRTGSMATLKTISGVYNSDPTSMEPAYTTKIEVHLDCVYDLEIRMEDLDTISMSGFSETVPVDMTVEFNLKTPWPLFGSNYRVAGDMGSVLKDRLYEFISSVKEETLPFLEEKIGNCMGSFADIPPLIAEIIKEKDPKIDSITEVLSNITLDLSSRLREFFYDMIDQVIEGALSAFWVSILDGLGMSDITVDLDLGFLIIGFVLDTGGLKGDAGKIIGITLSFPGIGLTLSVHLSRSLEDEYLFNGSADLDIGPLALHLELDPFMRVLDSMIMITGTVEVPGTDRPLNIAIRCPYLEEFRSCEISLGSTLGIEPCIPIPPLGIKAEVDAGFRLRYQLPETLGPHINEVRLVDGEVEEIEIFNPKEESLSGVRLEMTDENGKTGALSIGGTFGVFQMVEVPSSDHTGEEVRIELISVAGEVLDHVIVDLSGEGWLSRDRDGFGIWMETDGSPGHSNGGSSADSLKELLISIAISSLKQAWDETYELHGLSFDGLGFFLERAIDLFITRFLFIVAELVDEARMFVSFMVADASGTAGGGVELSFIADGDLVARFLNWLYLSIRELLGCPKDPQGSNAFEDLSTDDILECKLEVQLIAEIETPGALSSIAPEGSALPDTICIGICFGTTLSLPWYILGNDVDSWRIYGGSFVKDAPAVLVSVLYGNRTSGMTSDLWLMRVDVWME